MDIDRVLGSVRAGAPVVILDDRREFEGDLFCAAEKVEVEVLHFMIRQCSGFLCLAMPRERLEEIGIPRMSTLVDLVGDRAWVPLPWMKFLSAQMERRAETPFHFPVDLKGLLSGISVEDRYTTIRAMLHPDAHVSQFDCPGHLPLLGAHPQGFAGRVGHTESAVELCRMAGLMPAGLLCEICSDDGTMCRGEELEQFAASNGLEIVTISQLVAARSPVMPVIAG